MNKTELVREVAGKCNYTMKDTEHVIEALFEVIGDVVAAGEDVSIPGFGKFELKNRAARTVRHPINGEPLKIPESKAFGFSVSSTLKRKVRGEE